MKRLMTALSAAAVAFFAIGAGNADDTVTHGAGFEVFEAGDAFDASLDEEGGTEGAKFWWAADGAEIGTISNYTAAGTSTPIAGRPDMFAGSTNTKFLSLDTSSPLFRSVDANLGDGTFSPFAIPESSGIYLDTLVKFTPAEEPFSNDLDSGDKIAISYVEFPDDPLTLDDPETPEVENNEAWTNFVIRAGITIGEDFTQTNYYAAVPADFDKDAWHRLTVRTIKDVGDGQVGFVIFIDGDEDHPLAYAADVDPGFGTLNNIGQKYADMHALYPSAVASGATNGSAILAASFSGTGCIDDVVITTTQPTFIHDEATVRISWETNSLTSVAIAGTPLSQAEFEVGYKDVPYAASIAVVAAAPQGFDIVYTPPEGAGRAYSEGAFTGLEANDVCSIHAFFPLFDVGGVHYGTVAEAVDAAITAGTQESPATLMLLADYAGDLYFDDGYIILDLAGKTITGAGEEDGVISNFGAELAIINSTQEIGHVIPDESQAAFVTDDSGSTVITGGSFDGGFAFDASDAEDCNLTLEGGLFYDEEYEEGGEFYLVDFVADGLTAEYVSGQYFQVGEGGEEPPAPTTYQVTITGGANATYTAKIGNDDIESGDDVADESVITIVATPGEGYEYASQPEGWTLSEGSITKDFTVDGDDLEIVIPDATAVLIDTYQVTVIPTNNTTYAAAYNEGGAAVEFVNNVAAVTDGETITITVTPDANYEYASAPDGWTAGANGVITKEISAAATVEIPGPTAKSSYPTYIDPTDAEIVGKYNTWKATYGADTESAHEDAFLLNIAPDAADQTLEPASIAFDDDGNILITANKTLTAVNGTVYVKTATTLAGLDEALWVEATLSEGKVQVAPGASDTAGFYKIKVDFSAGNPES